MAKAAKPAAAKEEKSLAIPSSKGTMIDAGSFTILADPTTIETIRYNLRGEQISEFDLDRVKIPSGGGLNFQIPTLEGIDTPREIEGIILQVGIRRSFWSDPDPSGNPPDCYSVDGLVGIGDPGGQCANCPMNEFGSAVKQDGSQGKGKRCRERRMLLILRSEDRLPIVCLAPPASIKGIKQYLMRLPVPMYQAITSLKLEGDKSSDGVAYSKVVPTYVGYIDSRIGGELKKYAETLRSSLVAKAANDVDFEDEENDGNTFDAVNSDAMQMPDDK